MFFGGIAFFGKRTDLYVLDGDPEARRGGVTGRRILECLQEELPKILEPGMIYAQDNAPTHTARIVQDWLRQWLQENGIVLVIWPPYSPDLNPIENLWKLLKEKIHQRYPELATMRSNSHTLDLLIKAAQEVWDEFTDELIDRLIESMERRLQAVIDARGWYTKY